nr:FUSC family protein [Snuella sedimenti]
MAIIASFLAIILSVLPVSNLAIFPAIAALAFGLVAFYLSKKSGHVKKIIQFTFLLTIIAISISIYKAMFTTIEVAETKALEAKESQSKEEALKDLEEIDMDELEIGE